MHHFTDWEDLSLGTSGNSRGAGAMTFLKGGIELLFREAEASEKQ
jgi:hypothetical protein